MIKTQWETFEQIVAIKIQPRQKFGSGVRICSMATGVSEIARREPVGIVFPHTGRKHQGIARQDIGVVASQKAGSREAFHTGRKLNASAL